VNTFFALIPRALAASTHSSVSSGWKKVDSLLLQEFPWNLPPTSQVTRWANALHADGRSFSILPMSGATLLLFLCRSWLTSNFPGLESTMKAIKSVHRSNSLPDPFVGPQEWVIKRLVRAFKKMSPKPAKQQRRPITTVILIMAAEQRLVDFSDHDERCCWAALVVAVYALLRAGEFLDAHDGKLLTRADLTWMGKNRAQARLTLHNTKTMLWKDDVFAYIFQNQSRACPTFALGLYLDHVPPGIPQGPTDPLFMLSSGKRLTRAIFIPWVQELMRLLGFSGEDFNGISPRKGGAASLRLANAPNDVIRLMGRWAESSFVFERYQAISSRELSAYATRISALSASNLIAEGKGALLWGAFDTNGIFHEDGVQAFINGQNSEAPGRAR
jgi:hypothetical protein